MSLKSRLHPATYGRSAIVAIDIQGVDYDIARHGDGATLLINDVTPDELRSLANQLMGQAGELSDCTCPETMGESCIRHRR